jgi:transcriptional regulator with XRE-family HTH domain
MPHDCRNGKLTGHARRNARLRANSLERAKKAPPLARLLVTIRAELLGMTRLEFARRSGISRGTLRDLELGIHTPTRRSLLQFLTFCQQQEVAPGPLEELRRLHAGNGAGLEPFIRRLEIRAGSTRELARRVGISPATLWEYRRGHFPLPLVLLRQLCQAVGEDPTPAEATWRLVEKQRLLERGYPEPLAEFWVLCAREGCTEKHLLERGLSTATARRLRYLELPPWEDMVQIVRNVCQDEGELQELQTLWKRAEQGRGGQSLDPFGARLKRLRKQQGLTRRELADLFEIGGKKPARIIKYIEEDGFYSAQAHPAGLIAILTEDPVERRRLQELWCQRRRQFHRRHRPEMRVDLRLAREVYGFELRDMEPILGYSPAEYQRIERGVSPLLETAESRILQAIHQAGERAVQAILQRRRTRQAEQAAWQLPPSLTGLITLLARREGGLIPLSRLLRKAGLKGLWTARLREILRGQDVPAWPVVQEIARVCGVAELAEVQRDWTQRYRDHLEVPGRSPLAVEIRLLIAQVAATLRALSPRLGLNYSVLVRDLQRIDRDDPVKWTHVERILRAVGLPPHDERWKEIHALWYTASERRRSTTPSPRRRSLSGSNGEWRMASGE